MAKPLSRLLSPQRIKTNAKHAQNAAYNAAQVAAQSGQALPAQVQGTQPFNRRQMTDLKHQQNARYNQDVMAGNIVPPTPTPAQNNGAALGTAMGQPAPVEQPVNNNTAWQPSQGQNIGQAVGQATQSMFGAAGQPRPQPSANNGGQYRVSPGVYRNRPPQQNAIQRPTFGGASNLWSGAGSMGPQNQQWRKR